MIQQHISGWMAGWLAAGNESYLLPSLPSSTTTNAVGSLARCPPATTTTTPIPTVLRQPPPPSHSFHTSFDLQYSITITQLSQKTSNNKSTPVMRGNGGQEQSPCLRLGRKWRGIVNNRIPGYRYAILQLLPSAFSIPYGSERNLDGYRSLGLYGIRLEVQIYIYIYSSTVNVSSYI